MKASLKSQRAGRRQSLSPDVFVRAAELIHAREHACACFALGGALDNQLSLKGPYFDFFHQLFRPDMASEISCYLTWCGGTVREGYLDSDHARERRILALLLCAEIVRDEQRGERREGR